ncbi:EAL domain-containing protein [Deferribacter abyssi]|uniref:EAL domain-containing protein n=1 Tax=Deferribacter abyssi TaxID=213806 RepID=UPI003C180A8A
MSAIVSGYFIVSLEGKYRDHLNVLRNIERLGRLEQELVRKVLECNFLLYYNYSEIIDVYDKLKQYSHELQEDVLHRNHRSAEEIEKLVNQYVRMLDKKGENLFKFIRYNSTIKNTVVYIPTLVIKSIHSIGSYELDYIKQVSVMVSNLLLLRNNLDLGLIDELKQNIEELKSFELKNKEQKLVNDRIVNHFNVFAKYFPLYVYHLNKITDIKTKNILIKLKMNYQEENNHIFSQLVLLAIIFAIGVILSIGFIGYYILKLKKAATIDYLTGLYNRYHLLNDLRYCKEHFLFIINIDNFKHINNFYGVRVGDEFLKVFGKEITELVEKTYKAKIYRLGSDDFGVLVRKEHVDNPEKVANYLVNKIESNEFKIFQWSISVSISIGISSDEPLLEKADIALKYVKRNSRVKYAIYNENLNFEKDVEINMKVLKSLKVALEADKIIPYFQPIVDNKTGVINKFECLVRMLDEKDEMVSPGVFLDVAKKGKLYGAITKRVIEKSFCYFKNKSCEFSINISVDDIIDNATKLFIIDKLKKYPEIAKRLTFEILESEGIENFEVVLEFIKDVKEYGTSIAIDDFGSGYSNFSYLLQLNVDYIKIDGSLIKNIHIDNNSELIVSTIVSFAKRLNIKTVAEFVHNEEVYKKVIELGIDYSQGFFIGKPLASCH